MCLCRPPFNLDPTTPALLAPRVAAMYGADSHGAGSSSPSALLDPRIAALATLVVALLPYGAWRVLTRSHQQTAQDNTHQVTALDSQHAPNDSAKQKRSKGRRRRSAVPKLKGGAGLSQHQQQKKQVVRQPSAVAGSRKRRAISPADHPDELLDDTYANETPRPASVSCFDDPPQRGRSNRPIDISGDPHYGSLTSTHCPQDIPLPLSPVLAPNPNSTPQSPFPPLSTPSSPIQRPTSPLLLSPSVSTSASTSGTPLTPPSLMNSQVLPMAPLHALYTQDNPTWEWPTQSSIVAGAPSAKLSPKTKRPRNPPPAAEECPCSTKRSDSPAPTLAQADDRSKLRALAQELTFPTLNALPPPSMPLEDQVESLRSSIEASRAREQAARQREEALTLELEQSRIEVEQTRQETSRLQWQLNEISQREERVCVVHLYFWVLANFEYSVTKSNTRSDDATPNDSSWSSIGPSPSSSHGFSTSVHAIPAPNITLLSTPTYVRPALANASIPNTSLRAIPNHADVNVPSPPLSRSCANPPRPITEHARTRDTTRNLPTTPYALSPSLTCASPPPGSASPHPRSIRDGIARRIGGSDYEAPQQPCHG